MTATLTPKQEAAEIGTGEHRDLLPHVPVSSADHLPEDQGESEELGALQGLTTPLLLGTGPGSPAVSGLSEAHRTLARRIGIETIDLSFRHSAGMAYTQGGARWQGIHNHMTLHGNAVPRYSDCSSWATWVEWNGLFVPFGVRDTVNGQRWLAGYTGTMLTHGKIVHHDENLKALDLIVYQGHVAVYIGGGMVASHGGPGLHKLDMYYRKDVVSRRRVI